MDTNIKFRRSHAFEGKSYEGVDMAGLRKLAVKDLFEAQQEIGPVANMSRYNMNSKAFLSVLASMAAEKPRSFFTTLKGEDGMGLTNRVKRMLNAIEEEEAERDGMIIKITRPGAFGKKLDLTRLDEMTADEFAQAEEALDMAEWGSTGGLDSFNYKYCCAVAAFALNPDKPEKQLQKLMDAPFWLGNLVQGIVKDFFLRSGSMDEGETENPEASGKTSSESP